jgi:D-apionolactonase
MKPISPAIIREGCPRLAPALALQAGPLQVVFEPDTGFLRNLRLGQTEVLRGIYGAVRDPKWHTISPQVRLLKRESDADGFQLEFTVDCREADLHFRWLGCVTGDSSGAVKYSFSGEAQSSFWHNRIGLCVLHPVRECAGQPVWVETIDGKVESGLFPLHISPSQPFKNIRSITHHVRESMPARVRFTGGVFEMEDQRNWTDASFKTYCPPLELPYPTFIEAGTRLVQEIELDFQGSWPEIHQIETIDPVLTLELPRHPVRSKPPIGLSLAAHGETLAPGEIDRLQPLGLDHLRVDLRPGEAGWQADLRRANREVARLNVRLHVALFLTDQATDELSCLRQELAQINPPIALWMIFPPKPLSPAESWVCLARSRLTEYAPAAAFATGSSANFAELNRNRPAKNCDWLPCFSINPQVHAFDNTTLVENLEAQVEAVDTTRQFCHQPVVVSPITLRPRGHLQQIPWEPGDIPPALKALVDPRQLSLLGAGWTLGSLARLATHPGVQSLTYYETTGWRGVMEQETGCPWPQEFPSIPGAVFPLYHVFADLADARQLAPLVIPGTPRLTGLMAWDAQARPRLLLANLGEGPLQVCLRIPSPMATIRWLDETSALQAMTVPAVYRAEAGRMATLRGERLQLDLPALAWARIDFIDAP